MSFICPTFDMSIKRNTSKTQVMNAQEKIVDLKKKLDAIYATMPETFFEQQQRDKSAFLITKEIERLENPKSYRENVRFWEDHQIRL